MNTKNIAIALVGVMLAAAWIGLSARADYTWSRNVIQRKTGEGWVVASTDANVVDVTAPWTIFKSPVTRIAFFRPGEIIPVEHGMLYIRMLWVDYENMTSTREHIFDNIIDCEHHRSAFVNEQVLAVGLETGRLSLKWRADENDSSGGRVNTTVCASVHGPHWEKTQ